jgi:uncharacterized membrane protein
MKRLFDLANLVLLLLIGVVFFRSYPDLPARVPAHFNFAGRPDRWGSRDEMIWLAVLPAIATAVLYLMVAMVPRLAANPRSVNIPHKAEFLRLPAEKKEIYWAIYREFFAGLAAALDLLFYLFIRGSIEVAMGTRTGLPLKDALPAFILMGVLMVYYVWRMMSLPGKLIRGEV